MQKYITKPSQIDALFIELDKASTDAINDGKGLFIQWSTEKPEKAQTAKQRNSLHVWCGMIANRLNSAGYPRKEILLRDDSIVEYDWCKDTVKSKIYKPILKAIKDKTSTEDQATKDHDIVVRHIARFLSEKGIECPPWPSRERHQ